MNIIGLLFLLITHYFSGRGLLYLFKIDVKPAVSFFLSMILGVMIASMLPVILQFFYIPITTASVVAIIALTTILLNIKSYKNYSLANLKPKNISIQFYELPFLLLLAFFMLVSSWRCFYFPTFARDILSGPEAIAAYTLKEKTMLNSIFSLNLESTNNHLKPPFVSDLQIIYKMLVYPFGKIWLSIISTSFVFMMYSLLREKIHPILAGLAMLFFMSMPDPFAYTYIVLFDYSNMICFMLGFYFLARFLENKEHNYFLFSVIMFGFATYIREETLVLVGMIVPLIWYYFRKDKLPAKKFIIRTVVFLLIPFLCYYLWMGVFVKYYMPVKFDVGKEINLDFSNLDPFFNRFSDMNSKLIFGGLNVRLYGYFVYFFLLILVLDFIFFRKKMNTEARVMLYGILVVYIGLPLLGFLIPWFDLLNTTKRGLYKMFPLMLLYLRNSGLLTQITEFLRTWEMPKLATAKVSPVPQSKPTINTGKGNNKKKGKK